MPARAALVRRFAATGSQSCAQGEHRPDLPFDVGCQALRDGVRTFGLGPLRHRATPWPAPQRAVVAIVALDGVSVYSATRWRLRYGAGFEPAGPVAGIEPGRAPIDRRDAVSVPGAVVSSW